MASTHDAVSPAALDAPPRPSDLLRLSTAGSVDDGKSTLIGRLLYETGSVYSDHVAEAKRNTSSSTVRDAGEEIDFSLLTDGLKAEREQGITIDVAYRYFSTARRKFIIADTPGHEQYTRNMATGASTANVALVLVDARNGVLTQSKRHAFIASLLGIKHVVVCVNKMDLVAWSQDIFQRIRDTFVEFATRLEVPDLQFIPLSALKGDNVVRRSTNTPWYHGPPLLEVLENVHIGSDRNLVDLRFPVQYVIRPEQNFRGYAGQVATGVLRRGDEILVLPSRKSSRVSRIVTFDGDREEAFAPQSVTIVLEDNVDVSRGDMLVHPHNQPQVAHRFEAMIVWTQEEPLAEGASYMLKHTTQTLRARVERIHYQVDVNTLSRRIENRALPLNGIGRVVLSTHRPLYFDPYRKSPATGSLILIDPVTNATAGAGMILDREPTGALPGKPRAWHEEADSEHVSAVTSDERAGRLGQRPATIWLTGLPACGSTEIAAAVERQLFDRGFHAHVLDGGVLRRTLSHDLDHSEPDTGEHLRRVSGVARILNDAGLITICSFVSPLRAMRRAAREVIGVERFLEVHVASSLSWCEARDTKGVYAAARAGELLHVAGINATYEAPLDPDLVASPEVIGSEAVACQIITLLIERRVIE
jgi:bifunctional enzyme CysN/CysC